MKNMESNKLTKEEEIIKYIEETPHVTKDMIMDKFKVPKSYSRMIIKKVRKEFNKEFEE